MRQFRYIAFTNQCMLIIACAFIMLNMVIFLILQFSFLNIQTLHNDCSYIEHVHLLFCAHLINIFLFLGLFNLDIFFHRKCLGGVWFV